MIFLCLGNSKASLVSSGQISYARLHIVMKIRFEFKHAIGKSLESRFPDVQFVRQNPSFLNPENRRHFKSNIVAVIQRFYKERIQFSTAKMQYFAYRNDDSLEYLYLNSGKSANVFFQKLSKMPEYDQFG